MNERHSRCLAASAAVGATAILFFFAAHGAYAGTRTDPAVERGAYLVTSSGCGDCHTPVRMGPQGPQPDRERALSGHPESFKLPAVPGGVGGAWLWAGAATNTAFAGPWGVSYAANLTPDPATGIGNWSEAQFVGALRTGRHLGASRPILPPMPIGATSQMTDGDLKAIYAYLRTLAPVLNRVPQPVPPAARVAASGK